MLNVSVITIKIRKWALITHNDVIVRAMQNHKKPGSAFWQSSCLPSASSEVKQAGILIDASID